MPTSPLQRLRLGAISTTLLAAFLLLPATSAAQERWRAISLQAGVGFGSSDFGGGGASVAAELGVRDQLRVFAQWTDWQALASCTVADGLSECNTDADVVELGLRQGLGVGRRVAPFVGGGIGLYHRRDSSESEATNSVVLSVGMGLDIAVSAPLTVRFSLVHHEVRNDTLAERYGTGVRFTGFLVGLGLAVW